MYSCKPGTHAQGRLRFAIEVYILCGMKRLCMNHAHELAAICKIVMINHEGSSGCAQLAHDRISAKPVVHEPRTRADIDTFIWLSL